MMTALLLLACSGSGKTNNGDSASTNTDSSADSGMGDTAGACSTVTAGSWTWSGACPQMDTPVTVAVSGCDMTLTYGSMDMGMPGGASIVGTAVTFTNDNSVKNCTGTVESATKIEGSCDGGCTYKLKM